MCRISFVIDKNRNTIKLKKCNSDDADISVPDVIPPQFYPGDAPAGKVCSIIKEEAFKDAEYFAYVEVEDIAAFDLNKPYTLSVNGTDCGRYSALTYIKDVLEDDSSDFTLVNTVTAMYHCHQAAVAYFPNNG